MTVSIRLGHYEGDGGLVYLPIGFIPDHFRLIDFTTDTNIIVYEWWRMMETDEASGKQEGISYTEGVTGNLGDAAGITAYDTGAQGPTVTEWSESGSTAATAKTATAPGTYFKPTVDTGLVKDDRSAIFECVTAGTAAATEPTWPDAVGGQVTDGTVVWERVNVALQRNGYQGVCIAAAIQTDAVEYYYKAIQTGDSLDHGDVVGWTDGVSPE